MATRENRPGKRNRMLLSAGWAAGIGITLVEMQIGMDYVVAHMTTGFGFVVNWLPTISVLARHIWQ